MPRLIPPRVTRLGRPGITAGQRAQAMCRGDLGGVGPGARPDVGVVDHEAGIAGFESQPGLVFARGGQCGIGGRRVGKPSHDRQRALRGRLLERHMLPVGRQHRSAGRREQRNEKHGESLVALALGLDGAVRAETLSHAEQRIPGTRRCVHAVAAVPEQLGVGGEGFRPQSPLVGCAATALVSLPARALRARSPCHGSTQPACANSAVQMTSMPIMSMSGSPAARRRTSCSRCWSASVGNAASSMS